MRFDSDLVVEFASDSIKKYGNFVDIKKFDVDIKKVDLTKNQDWQDRQGIYFDIEVNDFYKNIENAITWCLKQFKYDFSKVLIVGLGNAKYVCDALGEMVVDSLPVIENTVAKFKPLVKNLTGMESFELVNAVIATCKPKTLILVDSLSTTNVERIAKKLQISNVGLAPGSGVGNARKIINTKSCGVNVISIGVPLVANIKFCNKKILMTPIDIEDKVKIMADTISTGILNAIK